MLKLTWLSVILLFSCISPDLANCLEVNNLLNYAVRQYTILSQRLESDGIDGFISTGNPLSQNWDKNDVSRWTVGFYGGTLWTLYKLTQDNHWRSLAEQFQERVKVRENDTTTHDVGFVIMSTYGLCLEHTGNREITIPVIEQTAKSLSSRFYPLARVIRSWENDAGHGGVPGEVKVIADNMMNLELLFTASALTGIQTFAEIAISHANRTIEEHFRSDGSTFHVVAYNETTGDVQRKYNWQGLDDNSTWARGIAWIIHGYSTSFEKTNGTIPKFLEYAEIAANYFIRRLPNDFVPYWDFDCSWATEYQPRDTSAAAIAAHGLLKLYTLTQNISYFETAEKILESLSSDKYRADGVAEYQIPSILVNGTVFYHEGNMNTAIVYGDFYFLKALELYLQICEMWDNNTTTDSGGNTGGTSGHFINNSSFIIQFLILTTVYCSLSYFRLG